MRLTKLYAPDGQTLAKKYWIDKDGGVRKSAAANLGGGRFETVELSGMQEFINMLSEMPVETAIALGTSTAGSGKLITERQKRRGEGGADAITRTKRNFSFGSGEGVLLLDIDYRPDRPALPSGLDLITMMRGLIPQLVGVEMVWRPSSSSMIRNTDTNQELFGVRGQHIFVRVKNASEIEALGRIIVDLLWLQGHGFCVPSKSGSILTYTLVDKSVFSPERIVYVAGAQTIKPLQQQRPLPTVRDGTAALALDQFKPLKQSELKTIERLKRAARGDTKEQAAAVRDHWIEQRIKDVVDPIEKESARRSLMEAVERRVLTPDIRLKMTDGEIITVADIISNPDEYDCATLHDPVEWDYPSGDGDSRIATIHVKNQGIVIFSWAHGGTRYQLEKRHARVCLNAGRLSSAVDALSVMSKDYLYRRGNTVVQVSDASEWRVSGFLQVQCADGLRYVFGTRCRFYTTKTLPAGGTVDVDVDIDRGRCVTFIDQARLQRVWGVVDHPLVTREGRVIDVAGLDEESRIMLLEDDVNRFCKVPKINDPWAQSVEAFQRVYDTVLKGFHFATPMDLSVALSALITAVLRPVLPLAPGYLVTAPLAGSGKTFFCDIASRLAEGKSIPLKAFEANEEELEKQLFSLMRSGSICVLLDNAGNGSEIKSAKLDAIMTTTDYECRVLGESRTEKVPNNMLLFITGNNVAVHADSGRRWLKIRIDPRCDEPHRLAYATDPTAQVMEHRQKIIVDLLTIVLCWLANPDRKTAGNPIATFGVWDAMVRQVIYNLAIAVDTDRVIGRDDLPEIGFDIEAALCLHEDPDRSEERAIMAYLYQEFKERPFTTTAVRNAYARYEAWDTDPVVRAEKLETCETVAGVLSPFMTSGHNPQVNGKRLGKWISTRVDKRVSGVVDGAPDVVMILRRETVQRGLQRYRIEVEGMVPSGTVVFDLPGAARDAVNDYAVASGREDAY
jgi:hypothetical protein